MSHPQSYAADPTPKEPAYASYTGFEQAGPSHLFQQEHTVWSQPTPDHSGSSWQQAPSEQWQGGNFHNY
jgi:hypothetical protein